MLADEAREFQELAVPTQDHPVVLLLPDGNANIFDLPTTAFYITMLDESNSIKCSRNATVGRIVPTTLQARLGNWPKLLGELKLCGRRGNINLRSGGSVTNSTRGHSVKRYASYSLACNLGRQTTTKDKRDPPREVRRKHIHPVCAFLSAHAPTSHPMLVLFRNRIRQGDNYTHRPPEEQEGWRRFPLSKETKKSSRAISFWITSQPTSSTSRTKKDNEIILRNKMPSTNVNIDRYPRQQRSTNIIFN